MATKDDLFVDYQGVRASMPQGNGKHPPEPWVADTCAVRGLAPPMDPERAPLPAPPAPEEDVPSASVAFIEKGVNIVLVLMGCAGSMIIGVLFGLWLAFTL